MDERAEKDEKDVTIATAVDTEIEKGNEIVTETVGIEEATTEEVEADNHDSLEIQIVMQLMEEMIDMVAMLAVTLNTSFFSLCRVA
jgi:CxxC motif-containing protein